MEPTLPVNCRVIVKLTNDVEVGHIAVFRYPIQPKTMFAQRVVAGPGDEVEIRDKHLIVNGREANEPYAVHTDETVYPRDANLPEPYRSRDQFGPYRVPADSYFVLGDNRERSSDSRYWGTVPHANIAGRVVFVVTRHGVTRPR